MPNITRGSLSFKTSASMTTGTCYSWIEDQMKTGPNEIGTAVYDWLLEQAKYGATEVSLYSDSYGGQNRNKYLVEMCIYLY